MKLLSLNLMIVAALAAQSLKLPGELKPWQRVELSSRVAGIVEAVEVDRGSVVKEGQVLVRLSAPEMQARVRAAEAKGEAFKAEAAEAEARAAASASTLERLQEASKTPGAVAGNEIVQAQKSVEASKAVAAAALRSAAAAAAEAQALRVLEGYLELKAPFSGVVTARHVHPGALASPQSGALLEIEQVSRLRLEVALPEAEVARVPKGARVRFSVPAHEGREFTGVVARVARSLDSKTRTMAVELDVDNSSGALAPGMYADVSWPVSPPQPAAVRK